MPTKTEFLHAASLFDQAATQVGGLGSSMQRLDVSSALQGGSLSRQVAERVAACAALANGSIGELHGAANLCRSRAAFIASYEVELRAYGEQLDRYDGERRRWSRAYDRWQADDGGHPGSPPVPPVPPADPPAWADVRRP